MRVNRSECSRGDYAMTNLDRRHLLAGAAAVGAATALSPFPTSTATAAVPPAGRAGAGFLSLQGRQLRMHLDQRRRALVPDARYVCEERAEGRGAGRGRSRLYAEGHGDDPVQPATHQHRQQAGPDRLRQRHRELRAEQGRGRPYAAKPRRRRRRSQEHRRRADFAFASRSHQRHPRRRRLDGVSERRDHGAGGGLGILDER